MASAWPTSLIRTINGCILARVFWLLNTRAARAKQTPPSIRTVTFKYVFITSGSPYCSRYRSAARVISGNGFVLLFMKYLLLFRLQNRCRDQSAHSIVVATSRFREDVHSH